jgi:hypothetical protein
MLQQISTEQVMLWAMAAAFGFGIGSMFSGILRATVSMLFTSVALFVLGSNKKEG